METKKGNNRAYQLWFYHVSHGHMVIRQPKDEENGYNTGFFFNAVDYLNFPAIMHNLHITTADSADAKQYCSSHSIEYDQSGPSLFILSCDEGDFHVVAGSMSKKRNQDAIMDVAQYSALQGLY